MPRFVREEAPLWPRGTTALARTFLCFWSQRRRREDHLDWLLWRWWRILLFYGHDFLFGVLVNNYTSCRARCTGHSYLIAVFNPQVPALLLTLLLTVPPYFCLNTLTRRELLQHEAAVRVSVLLFARRHRRVTRDGCVELPTPRNLASCVVSCVFFFFVCLSQEFHRLSVGDVLKFGESTRLYVLEGPDELRPAEYESDNLVSPTGSKDRHCEHTPPTDGDLGCIFPTRKAIIRNPQSNDSVVWQHAHRHVL